MSSPLIPRERSAYQAFTLIELLTVIAIIGILAAITFGVSKGVRERANISRAQTELAALATALEAYKRQYGDYPQIGNFSDTADPSSNPDIGDITVNDTQAFLFNALVGKRGPRGDAINGRTFVDLSRFRLERTEDQPNSFPTATGTTQVRNAFIDPWGRRYFYYYKNISSPNTWIQPSYLLYSVGPDGLHDDPPNSGAIDNDAAENTDNIYANR